MEKLPFHIDDLAKKTLKLGFYIVNKAARIILPGSPDIIDNSFDPSSPALDDENGHSKRKV